MGIYFSHRGLFLLKTLNQVYENNRFVLWCISENINVEELYGIYEAFTDFIMFWLNKMNEILAEYEAFYIIKLKTTYNYLDFLTEVNEDNSLENIFEHRIKDNEIEIELTPQLFQFLNVKNNTREKILMKKLIEILNIKIDNDIYEKIFSNQYIKKILAFDTLKDGYMVPMDETYRLSISNSDKNLINDDIGTYLHDELLVPYGIIKDNNVINKVVENLYCKLKEHICKFQKDELLKYLYLNSEKIISELYLSYAYYANNISAYPEHLREIQQNYNEINKVSVALKFLIELTSALKFNDGKVVSQYDTEVMLALAFEIIEWAYVNDLIYYHMISSPIKLLNSNRIDFDRTIINKSAQILFDSREETMSVIGIEKNKLLQKYKSIRESIDEEELKKAFYYEFDFSFEEFEELSCILLEYARKNDKFLNGICEMRIDYLMELAKDKIKISQVIKVIERLSLQERDDYLKPFLPYKPEDVYPWRFNRELSLNRRPLIIYKDIMIYGYRTLYNSIFFLLDLISSCKLKARSSEMKRYISKMEQIKGKNFNDLVYNYIISNSNLIVDKNVKKINGKKIRGKDNNDLGDIDILCISETKGIIKVIETKDFYLAKNFYEIYNEYVKMFDISNRKSFYMKHMKRVQWIEEHIDDVRKQYNLSDKKWKVSYLFVVDDNLVSKDVFDINVEITTLRNFNLDKLWK